MGGGIAALNLLTEPLIRIRRGDNEEKVTLPELFAVAIADDLDSVVALRPHQKQALHAFLVQVGAMALLAADRRGPPSTAEAWTTLLRGLAPDYSRDEPWCLVVDDLAQPAFLQPPVSEGDLSCLKEKEVTPDALDMLVTSKNHDLKAARITSAEPDLWLFALLTLQTCEGFLGRGNYGISRMNGGFASRPFVGIAPKGRWGAQIRRDMERLIELRSEIVANYPMYREEGGLGLVWLRPWDGNAQLTPEELDPYYVEICRRVRLNFDGTAIVAHRGASRKPRIAMPEGLNGNTGDPWTPIDRKHSKALTVDGSGFHYRRVAELLDPSRFTPAPLQDVTPGDGSEGLELTLSVTVRGQGETEGYHERRILIPPRAVPFFLHRGAKDRLAEVARDRVTNAATMRTKVLSPALFRLFQNDPDTINFRHPATQAKVEPFLARFDRDVDADFFDHLFEELSEDSNPSAARRLRRAWLMELKARAGDILATAEAGSPLSHVRRYRARAAAQSVLDSAFQNAFESWIRED